MGKKIVTGSSRLTPVDWRGRESLFFLEFMNEKSEKTVIGQFYDHVIALNPSLARMMEYSNWLASVTCFLLRPVGEESLV